MSVFATLLWRCAVSNMAAQAQFFRVKIMLRRSELFHRRAAL
jgi:hypothetical protein